MESGRHILVNLISEETTAMSMPTKRTGMYFFGTAWSSDGKTIKIDVNNGVITNVTMYHSNGNVAGTARPGASKSETYYDINGNTITRQQFKQQYPEVMIQVGAFEHEVQYLQK